jgi:hypothetical protein
VSDVKWLVDDFWKLSKNRSENVSGGPVSRFKSAELGGLSGEPFGSHQRIFYLDLDK